MDLKKFVVHFEPINRRPDIIQIKINWRESDWDGLDWNTNDYYRIRKLMFEHPISLDYKSGFESIRHNNLDKFICKLTEKNISYNFLQPNSDQSQLHFINFDKDVTRISDEDYEEWLYNSDWKERNYFFEEQTRTNLAGENLFEALPTELIEKIFNYFPQRNYVNNFKQVCSKWQAILNQPKFWLSKIKKYKPNFLPLFTKEQHYNNIRNLFRLRKIDNQLIREF